MSRRCRWQGIAPRGVILGMAAAGWVVFGTCAARGQQIQTRLPGLQAPASDNLESQILARISVTGEFQPDDLPRLARLAVLESIAATTHIQDDLAGSPLGMRLAEQATALWDASEAFSETVS